MGILYEEPSFWLFGFVTCLLGGWAAWMAGRSAAGNWHSWPTLVAYMLLLGVAVRFIHHALFDGTMFSLHYYAADTAVLLIVGYVGFRFTRAAQMVTQYSWIYERAGPLGWRPRSPDTANSKTR